MSCSGGNTNPMMGGRRRSRKMRGGNFYGFQGALAGSSAGPSWGSVENNAVDPVSGAVKPDYAMPGGRRRRTGKTRASRKTRGGRKSRRVSRRRRTMRGGAGVYNAGGVGYGYTGTGAGGLTDATAYPSRVGGAPMNADGVRSA
jgi:hypothetical protein